MNETLIEITDLKELFDLFVGLEDLGTPWLMEVNGKDVCYEYELIPWRNHRSGTQCSTELLFE